MQAEYFFLMKKKTPNKIDKILILDFNLPLTGDALLAIDETDLEELVKQAILAHLDKRKALKLPIHPPKALSEYRNLAKGKYDIRSYVSIDIEDKLKKGFFSKLFPVLGGLSSLASIVFNNIISMVSMQVVTAGLSNKSAISALSITESSLASVFNLIIYFSSPANNALTQFGNKIDNASCCNKNPEAEIVKTKKSCCASTKIILTKTLLMGLAVNYVVSGGITYYQELDGLGDKAKAANASIDPDLFDFIKWITVITSSMALLSFYFSFVQNAMYSIEKYFAEVKVEEEQAESKEESEDESIAVEEDVSTNKLLSLTSHS